MDLKLDHYKDRPVHFIGCGGAGMAPLMMILHEKGFQVSGSDLDENKNTLNLKELGIKIFHGHSVSNLPEADGFLTVFSSAVNSENPELAEAHKRKSPCIRRGELLALLAATYKRPVAVAGSHGKSSVSAMLSHIVSKQDKGAGYMVGAKIRGKERSGRAGNGDIFVCEVDESDGTNALIHPVIGVVTNVEDDHCWSAGGEEKLFESFRKFASQSGKLIYWKGLADEKIFRGHQNTIALDPENKTLLKEVEKLNLPGQFQRLNAAIALRAALELGLSKEDSIHALESFPGLERRMCLRYTDEDYSVIEDYAHHPTELKAAFSALKESCPDCRLTAVFQPHRYARLERYMDAFAEELKKADSVFVLPVFSAWSTKGRAGSAELATLIGEKAVSLEGTWSENAREILEKTPRKSVIAVLGAGDIEKILPHMIEKLSQHKTNTE